MNIREQAIFDLIQEAKKHEKETHYLEIILKALPDNNLMAMYVDVFGKPIEVKS